MKRTLSVLTFIAVSLSLALTANAIHQTLWDGAKFPLAGPDAGKLYDFISMARPTYSHWNLLPGTAEYASSKAPHGALVSTYANKIAIDSVKDEKGLADGSIIVMDNYTSDNKLDFITVMYKIKDYNKGAGNWFWVKYAAPNGYILESGKVESCIDCHSKKKETDFLY